MKISVLIIVGLIVAVILLAGVATLIGSRLSKSHTATRSIFLRQSPQNVYAVIRDFPSAPAWRTDVKRVEVQIQPDGKVHLREEGKNDAVNYELAEDVPGKRIVTRILDTDLGYSGKWTYVFAPENGGGNGLDARPAGVGVGDAGDLQRDDAQRQPAYARDRHTDGARRKSR